jgi:hypothetical protein
MNLSYDVLNEVKSYIINKIKFVSSKSKANRCDIPSKALVAQSAAAFFECLLNNMIPILSAHITIINCLNFPMSISTQRPLLQEPNSLFIISFKLSYIYTLYDDKVLQQPLINIFDWSCYHPLPCWTHSWCNLMLFKDRFLQNHGATWLKTHIQASEHLRDRLIPYVTKCPISEDTVI